MVQKSPRSRPAGESASTDHANSQSASAEALIDANQQNIEALMEANDAMVTGLTKLGEEMVTFGNARVNAQMNRSVSLLKCGDAQEAFQVNSEFFQEATKQYLDEANNLLTLMAKMTTDFWRPLETRTNEVLHDQGDDER